MHDGITIHNREKQREVAGGVSTGQWSMSHRQATIGFSHEIVTIVYISFEIQLFAYGQHCRSL